MKKTAPPTMGQRIIIEQLMQSAFAVFMARKMAIDAAKCKLLVRRRLREPLRLTSVGSGKLLPNACFDRVIEDIDDAGRADSIQTPRRSDEVELLLVKPLADELDKARAEFRLVAEDHFPRRLPCSRRGAKLLDAYSPSCQALRLNMAGIAAIDLRRHADDSRGGKKTPTIGPIFICAPLPEGRRACPHTAEKR